VPIGHASAHPPLGVLLSIPLGILPYQLAWAVWLLIEVALLATHSRQILGGQPRGAVPVRLVVATCLLLLWYPVIYELSYGQLGMLTATLLLGVWHDSKLG